MNPHEMLVAAILARMGQKSAEFNSGIITADRYLRTLQLCTGSDECQKFAATKSTSFHDLMTKAAATLTYNNEDMVAEDLYPNWTKEFNEEDIYGDRLELPKNTLMVFKHTLTSPRKDRDGDILRTQGAKPDPKMLLLFQHTHTLPIGKMLGVAEHNKNRLKLYSAIIDMNDLSHDSAVMVDNGMGRFSHGFKALEFEEDKGYEGDDVTPDEYRDFQNGVKKAKPGKGFDIKSFEIMEESLVSVPANTDAVNEEVLLSLVDGRKLTSSLMKSAGKHIREKRPLSLNIPHKLNLDLNLTVNGKAIQAEEPEHDEIDTKATPTETKCGCGCNGAPGGCQSGKKPKPASEEANAIEPESKAADDEEVKALDGKCPECGGKMDGKKCPDCGYTEKDAEFDGEKAGRVISSKNMEKLTQARDHIKEVHGSEQLMSRGGKAMCREAHNILDTVISSATQEGTTTVSVLTAKDAMAIFIAKATDDEQTKMVDVINTMKSVGVREKRSKRIRALLGKK